MIKRAENLRQEVIASMRGGAGQVNITHIIEKNQDMDEFNGKGRLFSKNTVKPGCSIGYHQHTGDSEIYYILSGEGIVDDNGTKSSVKAGDVVVTKNGESHSIENTGTIDLVIIALILFA